MCFNNPDTDIYLFLALWLEIIGLTSFAPLTSQFFTKHSMKNDPFSKVIYEKCKADPSIQEF